MTKKTIQQILDEQKQTSKIHKTSEVNINRTIANKQKATDPEFKKKISQSRKGKKLSNETKNKLAKISASRTHSEETKRKISESHIGVGNPNYGKKFTEEHRKKLSDSHRNRIVSDETKEKIRKSKLGKSRSNDFVKSMLNLPKVVCPHCGKLGQEKAMKRWHFDNCKHK